MLECRIGQCCWTNKRIWHRGIRESNGEVTSSEIKGNMRRRDRRIGNECIEYLGKGKGGIKVLKAC